MSRNPYARALRTKAQQVIPDKREQIKLAVEDWGAFQEALANPPEPNDNLRQLLRGSFNDVLTERIPDDIRELVEKLK